MVADTEGVEATADHRVDDTVVVVVVTCRAVVAGVGSAAATVSFDTEEAAMAPVRARTARALAAPVT